MERLAADHAVGLRQERHGALVGEGRIAGRRCLLAQPQTFMNRSGESVQRLLSFTGNDASALVVVHDDLDLPFGRLRLRSGGGAGGHRGVASVLEHLADPGFARLRIGVGRPPQGVPAEAYVLQEFCAPERDALPALLERAGGVVETLLARGLTAAMNACNPAPREAAGAPPPAC